jgi:hypothetical protein
LSTGSTVVKPITVAGNARATIAVHETAAGVGRGHAVSARVESTNGVGIVVERPMYFTYNGSVTGGHTVMGAAAPRTSWYFAEGYTGDGFDAYLTIMNPNATSAPVTVTYFLSDGSTRTHQRTVGPTTRATVAIHDATEGVGRGQAVAAWVTTSNSGGIIVERPMYFTYGGTITGGHTVLGAVEPKGDWYFAEGYTGAGFDEYLTILNPNPTAAPVTLLYYLADGSTVTKQVLVAGQARATVAVHESGLGVGRGQAVAARVTTTHAGGIVVERPMYFTYGMGVDGGHDVMGYTP